MVDPTQLALIHAEIDGELDDRQRAELSRHLLADPALRALRDEMRRLCRALDAVPQADPPARLYADILAALPQMQPREGRPATPWVQWRYAAVLAGVLLTGTIVFRIMDFGQERSATEMAGTLVAPRAAVTLDMVQLSAGAVSGQVSLIRNGTELGVAMQLAASVPVDVLIASGGRSVRVNGLGPRGNHGAGTETISLAGFGSNGQAVNLTFLIGEREVGRAVLRAPTAH
jgi:anti-sigma factor RsiW